MKLRTILCLVLLAISGLAAALGKTAPVSSSRVHAAGNHSLSIAVEDVFSLADFGAVGDGVTDDGPALQSALDALGESGGGTLLVPAGRYAITTLVAKDFTGLAESVIIQGVASSAVVPPPNSSGAELTKGLDLVSEFAPKTGEQQMAIKISGLRNFLIKDIGFIGTPNVVNDALITLALNDIWDATIRHCEFYGLSSKVAGGAIVQAIRSHLKIEQTEFLGSFCASGQYTSVVQNLEWKGIIVAETVFADYGQRAELYGKSSYGATLSWVSIGNAAIPQSDSPRREVVFRDIFLDEGSYFGLTSLTYLYQPPSAPIDLVYITGLFMNVSNFGTTGHYLWGLDRVLIEKSHYGWSHNAGSAISFLNDGNAIVDEVECVASADHIYADAATGKLTVINSVYSSLDSQAQTTKVISTATPTEDPVQYVRQKFIDMLGRAPDPAAHFYWSDQILQCGDNLQCVNAKRAALGNYLAAAPHDKFAVTGRIVDENGAGMAGVTVALSGSQNVTTATDAGGQYQFSNLPTSGVYIVTPSRRHYTLSPASYEIVTPAADQIFNSVATFNHHAIGGRVADGAGNPLAAVTVTLSGSQSMTTTTAADGNYLFADLSAGGNYTVTPRKTSYAFSPANQTFNDLDSDQSQNFDGTFVTYYIAGILVNANNYPIPGATVTLSGSQNRTTTSGSGGDFSFSAVPSEGNYTVTPTLIGYLFTPLARTYNSLAANQYQTYVGGPTVLAFSAASYSVAEGTSTITVTVERTNSTSGTTEVTYSGMDASARQRSDVIPVIGRLRFEPGETSKTFVVFITDDAYVEGNESMTLELRDLVGGVLGNNSTATLTITDNDSSTTAPNPIDDAQFFVRQHYRDFLNRTPDAEGFAFWSNQISSCGTDAACIADRRINVSAAFFLSIEFQQTGFLVYRLYQASFAQPPEHLKEFLLDTRTIGEGVVVNSPGWEQLLETNKTEFIKNFVARPQFTAAYPLNLSPAEFVDRLNSKAGGVLSPNELTLAVGEFQAAATSEDIGARARVLRRVAENETFSQRQGNPAFVLTQYFGYLQRNPSEAPDTNLDGYNFWLRKLDEFGGDFRQAEMVKSFLLSGEYRGRFGTP